MAKPDKTGGLHSALLTVELYKRNQGRLVRQLTAVAILVAVALGAWAMSVTLLADLALHFRWGVPAAVALAGAWFAFRIVNYPVFADFLIDVEGEMAKVSWPGKIEVWRATVVVLVSMFILSFVLFAYDVIWQQLLRWIGVLQF